MRRLRLQAQRAYALGRGFTAWVVNCESLIVLADGDKTVRHAESLSLGGHLQVAPSTVMISGVNHRSVLRNVATQNAIAAFLLPVAAQVDAAD